MFLASGYDWLVYIRTTFLPRTTKKKKKMETMEFKSAGVIRELPSTEAAKIPERREKWVSAPLVLTRHLPSSVQGGTLRRQACSGCWGTEENFWHFHGAGKTEIKSSESAKEKRPSKHPRLWTGTLEGEAGRDKAFEKTWNSALNQLSL